MSWINLCMRKESSMAKNIGYKGRGNLGESATEIDRVKEESQEKIKENPTTETYNIIARDVAQNTSLTSEEKKIILTEIESQLVYLLTTKCPEDYEDLKNEAKALSKMSQVSFILMAQRLKIIKEKGLYEKGGYPDFRTFIEKELPIAKTTVYCYIDIIHYFGVQTSELHDMLEKRESMNYSKLFPIIPLLKQEDSVIPAEEKNDIKTKYLQEIKSKSARKIKEEAHALKLKYKILKTSRLDQEESFLSNFIIMVERMPDILSQSDIKKLEDLRSNLGLIIDQNKSRGGVLEDWKETFFKNLKSVIES